MDDVQPLLDHGFEAVHPHPGADPVRRLAHVLEIYADQPDDAWAVRATQGAYGPDVVTGLTFGDLRALANRTFPVFPHAHYRHWAVPSVLGPMRFRTNNTSAEWWSEIEQRWVASEDARDTTEFRRVYPEAIEIKEKSK